MGILDRGARSSRLKLLRGVKRTVTQRRDARSSGIKDGRGIFGWRYGPCSLYIDCEEGSVSGTFKLFGIPSDVSSGPLTPATRRSRRGTKGGHKFTSSPGLSLLPTLHDLLLQLLCALFVFLVALLTEFPNSLKKVIHILAAFRRLGCRIHGGTRAGRKM